MSTSSSSQRCSTTASQIRTSDNSSTSSLELNEKLQESNEISLSPSPSIPKRSSHSKGSEINNIDRYQLEISLFVIVSLLILNSFESIKPITSKFLTLQNKYPDSNRYDIHFDDVYIVIFGIFIVTFIRSAVMNYFLGPIALHLNINGTKPIQRFKEQGWYLIYYSISFTVGAYIYITSPYFLNCDNLWIGWPHDQMSALLKSYYLIELACWIQQIFILNIEEKRKDHAQMFSHHIITCCLVTGSYYYYFTSIGNVILVMMDVVDIFLSLAKVLKYCGFQTLCDAIFGFFLISWIVVRHGFYNYILYHTYAKSRGLMEINRCVEGIDKKRCFTDFIMNVFLVLLAGIQFITIIWMYLIAKVAIKVITGKGADDLRSDDED